MPRDFALHPDPLPIAHPDTVRDKPDLSRPSLEALAYILRHIHDHVTVWTWDFGLTRNECGTAGCALGIASVVWPEEFDDSDVNHVNDEGAIFQEGMNDPAITPEVVASRIDDHLAGRPIRYLVEGDRGTAGR